MDVTEGNRTVPQRIGSDEWGDVVTSTPDCPTAGHGISVQAARKAIDAYDSFQANHYMPPHTEDQVFLIQGPVVDSKIDGTPVGWYAHLPDPEPAWWPPQPGDVVKTGDRHGALWLRSHSGAGIWRGSQGSNWTDDDMHEWLTGRGARGTLLVRGGKPHQP